MNLLFVCNQGQHRSRTAAEIYSAEFKTKYAGLYSENPVSEEQMSWADTIVVMEDQQRTELSKRFPKLYLQKRILSLNIPDVYNYGQHELSEILSERMATVAIPLLDA